MADTYCPDCKRATEVVFDHSAGDTVCSECGLVLKSHSIDETFEWRTFANESGDNDPVRVGGPSNPVLADGGLTTLIAKPNRASGDFPLGSIVCWQSRGANPDRSLIQAFKIIGLVVELGSFALGGGEEVVGGRVEVAVVVVGGGEDGGEGEEEKRSVAFS